ncbi:OmpH family outer membrane protein [uncultured Porticoccus sp.]|uniref:OmpH family outer membrane protein n=1 Tax=uncultured Porticoccus sp. TaxID=1256050 RepID=UPI00262E8360|nr:OmpH family outer membrane protein [uncultured Porticoccus sp.]
MRLVKKLFIITVALCSASAFSAEANAAEGNIAIVDFGRAIFGTDVAKARLKQKQGESDYAGLEAKYEGTVADMKALKQEVDSKSMTWSKEQAEDAQKKMEYYRADLELITRKIQADQKDLQNSIVQELRPKAAEALQEVVDEEGIVLLINAEAVVTAAPSLDITDKLTDRLNKKTK